MDTIRTWAVTTGIRLAVAAVLLVVSFYAIGFIAKKLEGKLLERKKFDETLTKTLIYAAKIALKVIIVCALIGYVGIETGALTAVIGSLGVCAGLAVNGALSNLAGGVLLLVTRPFKLGDYIQAQGVEGTVEEIRIISTKIVTVDNRTIYLPNGNLSTGTITNMSEKELRRVDLDFSVAGNDPGAVKKILLELAEKDSRILSSPVPTADISEYGAGNGTRVTLRSYCKNSDYWDVRYALLTAAEKAFKESGIVIPVGQLDVHVRND